LLGEKLFWKDILGIVLIISSVYIISWKHISFKEHISSKPVLLAWSVSFFAAAIAVLEKTILSYDSVPVALYALILYFLPAIFMLPFLNKSKIEISKRLIKNNFKEIFIASCFMLVSYYTALTSYKLFPISIVSETNRSSPPGEWLSMK
jgi:drug/metabolite transporter (DMT)-like permease